MNIFNHSNEKTAQKSAIQAENERQQASLDSFEPIMPQKKSSLLSALLDQGVVVVKNAKTAESTT